MTANSKMYLAHVTLISGHVLWRYFAVIFGTTGSFDSPFDFQTRAIDGIEFRIN